MGGRDRTSELEIWHYMSNSQKGDVIFDKYRAVIVLCETYKILENIL